MSSNVLALTPHTLLKRNPSIASIDELSDEVEDKSLFRAGEIINLTISCSTKFIENIRKFCQSCIGGSWRKCPANKLSVKQTSSGGDSSNYLYLCSLEDDVITEKWEPRTVLIRMYGSIFDQKNRFYENIIFTLLSERGYGPKILGLSYSGRIEELIPHRHMFRYEFCYPHITVLIARKIAEFHCMQLPLNKTPIYLWENIEKYLSMSDGITFEDDDEQQFYESIKADMDFVEEYHWLKRMLMNLHSPVVFCHNDLQEGNVLYINNGNGTKAGIKLIGFDYCGYNYRGYDIANHFCEFMFEYTIGDDHGDGFVAHSNAYPTYVQRVVFVTEYVARLDDFREKSARCDYDHQRFVSVIDTCIVEDLLDEVNSFALASHFVWGLWAIIQQRVSKIEFSYLKYAKARFQAYARKKEELGYVD